MAWTAPRTWVVGEIVTAAMLNSNVRDNLLALRDPPACAVRRVVSYSVPDSTSTNIDLDTEDTDTDGMWALSPQPTRITIQTTGFYLFGAMVLFDGSSTGHRQLWVDWTYNSGAGNVTAADTGRRAAWITTPVRLTVSAGRYLQAGDYLRLWVWQNAGGALLVLASDISPNLWAVRA